MGIVMQERSENTGQGFELYYRLAHSPVPDSIRGRIEVAGKSIQRFLEEKGIVKFYNDFWVDDKVEGLHVLDGKVTGDGIVLVWIGNVEIGKTAVVVNYRC